MDPRQEESSSFTHSSPLSYERGQSHPSIMLTKSNIERVRQGVLLYPLLKKSYAKVQRDADKAISSPISVPIPQDDGSGKTHDRHKRNYQNILACGVAYQITQDIKYAEYVQAILLEYAKQYISWPLHPKRKQGHPAGKIFWQNLNECVWQVHVIQGYDLVYDYISPTTRKEIEDNLFRPLVNLLMIDESKTFNLMHNHGTWSCAAVGMSGYVLGNPDWVEMALKGSAKDRQSGFLRQLEVLFSPDGYYSEGPYYQRYALLPFVVFAKAIQQYQPELGIYEFRNNILEKAVHTALQLTYTNGAFFPINDAIKDATYECEELVYAVDIAYEQSAAEDLLDIISKQKRVIVSDAGLNVAASIASTAANKVKPFKYRSMWIGDGMNGDEGGLGILRAGESNDQQCVVLKASGHGMGHGHYDRLNILYYDNGGEIFSDYGAARFSNTVSKGVGHYLAENAAFAKQTIAHNTVVVDKTSHYFGQLSAASSYCPHLIYFNTQPSLQIACAKEDYAYDGVSLTRTTALITIDEFEKPLLMDIVKATSNKLHQYDLPFWYQGSLVNIPFAIDENSDELRTLGESEGYQFLWLNSTGNFSNDASSFLTMLNNNRFYTTSFLTDSNTSVKFTTLGANDPESNFRPEKAFILNHINSANQTFVSITETHGKTTPLAETTTGPTPNISNIKIILDNDRQTAFKFESKEKIYTATLNYNNKQDFFTFFTEKHNSPQHSPAAPAIPSALNAACANYSNVHSSACEASVQPINITAPYPSNDPRHVTFTNAPTTRLSVDLSYESIDPSFFMQILCSDTVNVIGWLLLVTGLMALSVGIAGLGIASVGAVVASTGLSSASLTVAGAAMTAAGTGVFACQFFTTRQWQHENETSRNAVATLRAPLESR